MKKKGHEFGEEGCLSFPQLYAEVERNREVRVRWHDLDGTEHQETFSGWVRADSSNMRSTTSRASCSSTA